MKCLAVVCRRCSPGRVLGVLCPCLHRCLYSKHNEFFIIKFIFGVIFGAALGAGLHYLVIVKLPYPWFERSILGGTITILFALGFGVSVQIRCVICLVLPHFFGKNGRGIVSSLAVIYLLAGPVANIVANGQESARSIACTAALSFNHSKEIFELLHKPFTNAFKNLETQREEIEAVAAKVQGQFSKFQKELEGKIEGQDKLKGSKTKDNFEQKMEFRCQGIFQKAVENCKAKFRETEQKCYKAIKVPGIKHFFCLPLKLTALCKIVQAFDLICDKAPVKTEGLMATYYETKQALRKFSNNFKADLRWQVTELMSLVERVSVQELQAAVKHEIERKKLWFDLILGITRAVLSVTFVLVFKSAFTYSNRYLREIRFDNVYMTSYFMKIERRRRKQGRRCLLPLKKSEQKDLIEPFVCSLQKNEKSKLIKRTVRLLPQILVTVFLIAFDYLFFTALDLIQRHSQVDFKFSGHHVIRFAIHGDGAVASVFQKVFLTFNSEHQVAKVSTNKHCLPRPNKVKRNTNMLILGLWLGVWVLLYFEAYGLRIRRVICAFFYPKREKKRTLFLYNEYLRKRVGFLKHARKRVRRTIKEQNLLKEIGLLAELRHSYPRMCGWLYRLGLGKKRCLICGEVETRGARHCANRRCKFMYCAECYQDVKGKCYACSLDSDDESDDESTSDWDI